MKHPLDNVKVAIVYDHVTTQYGGAELVLQVLLALFPEAPLYTTVFDNVQISWVDRNRVRTSFLQNFGWMKKQHQVLAPLHPFAIEQLDLSEYDLIISVTAGVAKGVQTLPHQLHVCYLLTPTRYLQTNDVEHEEYLRSHWLLSLPFIRSLSKPLFEYITAWDQVAAWRPDKIIAISQLVSNRILNQYGRQSDMIIYPPFIPFAEKSTSLPPKLPEFFLSFSRLVSYKRVDLAIKSCLQLHKMLIVAGEGMLKPSLESIAPTKTYIRKKSESLLATIQSAVKHNKLVVFVGHCTESEKQLLLTSSRALIMAGVEDFGLTALEAAAVGTVSIINANSGVAEILTEPKYAIHLQNKSISDLSRAIQNVEKNRIDTKELRSIASNYNQHHFSEAFMNTLYHFWHQHSTISAVKLQM